jgi:hypothetical protein
VGAFFIPVINLILPHLIMQEVWKASAPADDRRSSESPGSLRIVIWWALSVVAALSYVAIFAMSVLSLPVGRHAFLDSRPFLTIFTLLNILGPACMAVANVMLIGIIEEIIQRQSKKHQIIAGRA